MESQWQTIVFLLTTLNMSLGSNVLPTLRVKCFGVFGSHCLVMHEAAVSSVAFMNTEGVRWFGLH